MNLITTQEDKNRYLRIQREGIRLVGLHLENETPLIKGEEFSRKRSLELFKNEQGFGFEVSYDEFGKPWPKNKKGFVSVSHAKEWLFISYSPNTNHGIDIEHKRIQLSRIAPRILNDLEMSNLMRSENLENALQVFWGAKEALYKAHGRKKLNFKENILVDSFNSVSPDKFSGHIILNDQTLSFELEWLKPDENSWLVFITKQLSH